MRKDLPVYTETNTTLQPGLYLGLFHGRKKPDEELDDWGFNGPVIGPLEFVHTTYASEVKIEFKTMADFERYFPEEAKRRREGGLFGDPSAQLSIHEDMLVFEGEYFGDWTVYVEP